MPTALSSQSQGIGQTDDGQWAISYSYGISDPGYYYYRYGEPTAISLDITASNQNGDWTNSEVSINVIDDNPTFSDAQHRATLYERLIGNQTQTEFKSSDCEDWAHVNFVFTTGEAAEPEGELGGTVLIGEDGNQIAIQVTHGQASSITVTSDGVETELAFTLGKYGRIQFDGDPSEHSITINGIEMSVDNAGSGFKTGEWDVTLNTTLVDGQDAVEWRDVPVTAISENGSEARMELNFRVNNAPFASSSAAPTFLDLFNEAVDDDIDLSSKPEKAEEEQTDKSGLTFADLLMEESEYDDIVLPGGEYEPQEAGHANTTTTIESSVIDGGDDLAMLAALREVENV